MPTLKCVVQDKLEMCGLTQAFLLRKYPLGYACNFKPSFIDNLGTLFGAESEYFILNCMSVNV